MNSKSETPTPVRPVTQTGQATLIAALRKVAKNFDPYIQHSEINRNISWALHRIANELEQSEPGNGNTYKESYPKSAWIPIAQRKPTKEDTDKSEKVIYRHSNGSYGAYNWRDPQWPGVTHWCSIPTFPHPLEEEP